MPRLRRWLAAWPKTWAWIWLQLARLHPGQKLDREDVEQAVRGNAYRPAGLAPHPDAVLANGKEPPRREPVGFLRRIIADRMAASAHITAPVTLTTLADASELVRLARCPEKRPPLRDYPKL